MIRAIIRPEHIHKTPALLSEDLAVPLQRYPGLTKNADFERDLFLVYPRTDMVDTKHPETYSYLRNFYASTKAEQRKALGALGLPIPATYTTKAEIPPGTAGKFVVRPMRHEGGKDYKLTDNPRDFREGVEYVSELFPKEREYRLLCVYGKPLLLWQKPQEDQPADGPWGNHKFLTVQDWANSYLVLRTSALDDIPRCPVAKYSHIVGFDILLNTQAKKYVVLEANVCPGLTIHHNRATVVDFIKKNHK